MAIGSAPPPRHTGYVLIKFFPAQRATVLAEFNLAKRLIGSTSKNAKTRGGEAELTTIGQFDR